MIGLSTSGSISFGCALVAGRNRVPRPAAGKTALRTVDVIACDRSRGFGAYANIAMEPEAHARSCFVRDHIEAVRAGLRNRGLDPDKALEEIATLETARRRLIPELEGLKRQQNTSGDEVARAKRQGQDTDAPFRKRTARAPSRSSSSASSSTRSSTSGDEALLTLPNLPHASVPVGKSAADNVEVRRHGEPRAFDFEPKAHWDLGAGARHHRLRARRRRMSGARFSVLSGAGARLSRALINFMLDLHTREHGYREVEPPFLVNSASLVGTGNLPKFEAGPVQDRGRLGPVSGARPPRCRSPTCTATRFSTAAICRCATRPTRRASAARPGPYGQDVRGLIRQHQFDKVELVKFTTPEQSYDELESADAPTPRKC